MRSFMALLALSMLLAGCHAPPLEVEPACVDACQSALGNATDLSDGPCLLDPIAGTDWVCDVAHDPRQPLDNLPENQCSSYRSGVAHHFVEVSPDCGLIRSR